jgi:hypothetical protein
MLCVFLEVGATILVDSVTWITFRSEGDRWKPTVLKKFVSKTEIPILVAVFLRYL